LHLNSTINLPSSVNNSCVDFVSGGKYTSPNMSSRRSNKGRTKEKKPIQLVKVTKSARLPSCGCCNLVKATKTAKSSSSSLRLDEIDDICGCPCLVKATKTAKHPLAADDETINDGENIYSDNNDSFRGMQRRMNEKSSVRLF
uniref:Uncharacterized protein n=1 Tax=Meloidogyne javanica TaxID=6303 RepID=A0A915LGA1_MELJA